MTDFADGLQPSTKNLVNQIKKHENFIYKFKTDELSKTISKLSEIYSDPVFSYAYKKNQIHKIKKISESLDNTFVIGKSSITEVKKFGDLNLDWKPLKSIISDYENIVIRNIQDHLNTFYISWRNKTHIKGKISENYSKSLEEHIKITDNFRNFNPEVQSKKINKFVNDLELYTKELSITIDLIDFLYKTGSSIENILKSSNLKNNLKNLREKLESNSNKLLNARITYLEEISKDFENEFLEYLKNSQARVKDKTILDIAEKTKIHSQKNIVEDLKYSTIDKNTSEIKKGLDLINSGKNNLAKKVFEDIIESDNECSKAYFYRGLEYLRDSKNLDLKNKTLSHWYHFNLRKAIYNFKKALEFSVGENPKYQSENYAFLAYSKLLHGKSKRKELFKISNKALKISKNSISNLVKAKIMNNYYTGDRGIEKIHLEDLLKKNISKITGEDLNRKEISKIFSPEDKKYETAEVLLKLGVSEDIEAEKYAKIWLSETKDDPLSYLYISKILDRSFSDNRKKAQKIAKKALKIVQKNIEKHKDNPKNIKFLLKNGYYEYYLNYAYLNKPKKRRKILKKELEMENTGIFNKIR